MLHTTASSTLLQSVPGVCFSRLADRREADRLAEERLKEERKALENLIAQRQEEERRLARFEVYDEIEAPLVMVDAIWLGDAVVEWVTVAVCEPCATDEVSGLLGLNVSGQFQVALDHDHHQVELSALGSAEDRKLDVSRWLTLGSRILHWQDGRVEVEVTGENTAQVAIREFSVEIACPGGRFEVIVDGLGSGETITRKMALPRGTDCSEYVSELRDATWERSRF